MKSIKYILSFIITMPLFIVPSYLLWAYGYLYVYYSKEDITSRFIILVVLITISIAFCFFAIQFVKKKFWGFSKKYLITEFIIICSIFVLLLISVLLKTLF
jgi:hypothetical protein